MSVAAMAAARRRPCPARPSGAASASRPSSRPITWRRIICSGFGRAGDSGSSVSYSRQISVSRYSAAGSFTTELNYGFLVLLTSVSIASVLQIRMLPHAPHAGSHPGAAEGHAAIAMQRQHS